MLIESSRRCSETTSTTLTIHIPLSIQYRTSRFLTRPRMSNTQSLPRNIHSFESDTTEGAFLTFTNLIPRVPHAHSSLKWMVYIGLKASFRTIPLIHTIIIWQHDFHFSFTLLGREAFSFLTHSHSPLLSPLISYQPYNTILTRFST
jgi:hypothetical protein